MSVTDIIEILAATVAALAFSLLFNIRGNKLLAVAAGGGLGWLLVLLLQRATGSETLAYFIVALVISLYAEVMARVLKAPTTIFIAPSLIPLVPGASLYYTMTYVLKGDSQLFAGKAFYTLELASALALGIIGSAVIMKLFTKIHQMVKARSGEH